MNSNKLRFLLQRLSVQWLAAAITVLTAGIAYSQPSMVFSVVTPGNGQVFRPGDVVPVTVQPASGVTLTSVTVISAVQTLSIQGAGPVSFPAPQNRLGPIDLLIKVESSTNPAAIQLTIQVETSTAIRTISAFPNPVRLVAPETSIVFPVLGSYLLNVVGGFADGVSRDIRQSSQITYSSDRPSVATVDSSGLVTAIAPGTANITIAYRGLIQKAPVQVNIFELRGDLNGDNDVDQGDVQLLQAVLNTLAMGPGDPRDLNRDRIIDSRDLQMVMSLCSRPNCATK